MASEKLDMVLPRVARLWRARKPDLAFGQSHTINLEKKWRRNIHDHPPRLWDKTLEGARVGGVLLGGKYLTFIILFSWHWQVNCIVSVFAVHLESP